jgi:predicted PurR-regulated permease PerM
MPIDKDPHPTEPSFLAKVLIVALIAAFLLALWRVAPVFMLGFGGIVVAVGLHTLSTPLARATGMPDHAALATTTIVLVLLTVGFLTLFGAGASAQFAALIETLPVAWQQAREWLEGWALGRRLLEAAENSAGQAAVTVLSALPLAGGFIGGLANAFLILVLGIYLAADHRTYERGLLSLLPPDSRPRARKILVKTGENLTKWLTAMTLDMLFLGTVTGIGLWLVGVPFAFPLGVLSGLSVFVPYIGPIVATVPGLLLALSVSPSLALYAAIVYVVAQQLEGNISLPLLQRWTVHMPPVVSLLAMVAFGLLFGFWGVLLATPMAVATMTVVRMAYVEDFLERRRSRKDG